ncbi:Trm112 family protein [bacterium]|nr:Trm112 family protein [bacterium]MBU1676855.1 Trm112 family protein [bacterium]
MLKPELLEILACPACKGQLRPLPDHSALDCPVCKLRYRVEDDIPIMLLDEAEPLPESKES